MIRLDKFLAEAGVGTRTEVKKLIKAKKVTVDGKNCYPAGTEGKHYGCRKRCRESNCLREIFLLSVS